MDFSLIVTIMEIADFLGILRSCNYLWCCLDPDLRVEFYQVNDGVYQALAIVEVNRRLTR